MQKLVYEINKGKVTLYSSEVIYRYFGGDEIVDEEEQPIIYSASGVAEILVKDGFYEVRGYGHDERSNLNILLRCPISATNLFFDHKI